MEKVALKGSFADTFLIPGSVILGDKGGVGVSEILYRQIGEGVDLDGGGEGGHNGGAEAVDQPLYHEDAEVHDRLLHAGHGGQPDDLL